MQSDILLGDLGDQMYHFIHLTLRLFSRNTTVDVDVIENTIGVLHNTSNISENTRKNGCVIIEGAPHENKMAGKGQITRERASS